MIAHSTKRQAHIRTCTELLTESYTFNRRKQRDLYWETLHGATLGHYSNEMHNDLCLHAQDKVDDIVEMVLYLTERGYSPMDLFVAAVNGVTAKEMQTKLTVSRANVHYHARWRFIANHTHTDGVALLNLQSDANTITEYAMKRNAEQGVVNGYSAMAKKRWTQMGIPEEQHRTQHTIQTAMFLSKWPPAGVTDADIKELQKKFRDHFEGKEVGDIPVETESEKGEDSDDETLATRMARTKRARTDSQAPAAASQYEEYTGETLDPNAVGVTVEDLDRQLTQEEFDIQVLAMTQDDPAAAAGGNDDDDDDDDVNLLEPMDEGDEEKPDTGSGTPASASPPPSPILGPAASPPTPARLAEGMQTFLEKSPKPGPAPQATLDLAAALRAHPRDADETTPAPTAPPSLAATPARPAPVAHRPGPELPPPPPQKGPAPFVCPRWVRGATSYASQQRNILLKVGQSGAGGGVAKGITDALHETVATSTIRKPLAHQRNAITAIARTLFDHNSNMVASRGALLMLPPGSGKSTIGALLSLTAQQLFCVDATVLVVPPNLVDTWMDEIRACIASDDQFAFHAVILDKTRILRDHPAYIHHLVMAARGLYDADDKQYTTFFLLKTSLLNENPESPEARALAVFMQDLTTQLATLVIADETHLSFRAPDSTPARNWRLMFDGTGHPNPPLMLGMSATPVLNKEREFKTMLELLGVRLPPGLNLQDLKTAEARALLESVTIDAQVTAYKPYDNVRPHATVLMRVNRVEDDARPKYTEALKQTIGLLDGDVSLLRLPKLRAAADIAQHVVEGTGENVCVFVDYVQALHALQAELEARGLHVVPIHGAIPLEQRRRSIEEALASPYAGTVFLGTSQAMGTGLNLHRRCRVAITVSSQWSLKLQEQLDGRLRRIRDPGDPVAMTTSIILQGDASEEEDVFRAAHAKLERMAMPSEGEFEDDPPDLEDLLPCPPEMVRETAAAILAFHSGTGRAIQKTPYTRLDLRLSRCPYKACLADAAQTPAIGDEASRVLQGLQALATGV